MCEKGICFDSEVLGRLQLFFVLHMRIPFRRRHPLLILHVNIKLAAYFAAINVVAHPAHLAGYATTIHKLIVDEVGSIPLIGLWQESWSVVIF